MSAEEANAKSPEPQSFDELAASRREWIESVLRPWCQRAPLKELRRAEAEWLNIAGRVDVTATLWTWAWERFAALTYPDLPGVNETEEVRISLRDGSVVQGYPDSRLSQRGVLVLVGRDSSTGRTVPFGPFPIDDITDAELVAP